VPLLSLFLKKTIEFNEKKKLTAIDEDEGGKSISPSNSSAKRKKINFIMK
jgi:hypothetical protein